jgi:acyl dehydratase
MQFADFSTGQRFEAGPILVSAASIIKFARDYDPQIFHIDEAAASKGRWQGLIASGWHTCAIAMRLVVEEFLQGSDSCGSPGLEYLKWPTPVRPGDQLRLHLEVLETKRSRSGEYGIVRWRWRMCNQTDQTVLDLIATSLFGGA